MKKGQTSIRGGIEDVLFPMETEPTLAEMVIQNRADLDYLLMFAE